MTISLKDYTFTRLVFILITAIKKILKLCYNYY